MIGREVGSGSPHRIWLVLAAVGTVVLVAIFLSFLMARVVFVMRDTANDIDDARAINAVQAAVAASERRLLGSLRDNAVWDEAFVALNGPNIEAWVWKNWGSFSTDYALYDGIVVTDAAGRQISGYLKGKAADMTALLGPAFVAQAKSVTEIADRGIVGKFRLGDGVAMVGSHVVSQEGGAPAPAEAKVLTMVKLITPALLEQVSIDFQIEGLRYSQAPGAAGELSFAFQDPDKASVGFLVWPERLPGSNLYERVRPILLEASLVFFILLAVVLIAGFSEARALRRLASAADHEATHDALSRLLNRAGLIRNAEAYATRRARSNAIALYLVDLDGFKTVNDTWGHAVGDELIRAVAHRLSVCHPAVALAARLGGDEFCLVGDADADPQAVAEAAIAALAEPFEIGGRHLETGASVGYVVAPPQTGVLELLRRADMALYRVKEQGRGHALAYSTEQDEERERMSSIEAELRRALNDEQITVVFQPVVSCQTGKLKGVEALARWHRPDGAMPPDMFIPLAEKAGLINVLGGFVLQRAIRFARAYPDVELSVNVSPVQLCHPDFVQEVMDILRREDFDPHGLILEVTEGVLIEKPDRALRAIKALKAEGVRFALDDFGTGYASLGALRNFGFDRMKIDRSLVWAIDNDAGREVLNATISLASALNIPVTAEGVETASQAEVVRHANCDLMQGYLLGKPMSAEDFDRLMVQLVGAA